MVGYAQKHDVILIASPQILAVNIIDNQEPMVDLKQQNEIAFGPSPEVADNTDYTKLRKTVEMGITCILWQL